MSTTIKLSEDELAMVKAMRQQQNKSFGKKKSVGQKAFTDEERRRHYSQRVFTKFFNGEVHRWMENDVANATQYFYMMTAHPSNHNKSFKMRFSRTAFRPDGVKHNRFLDEANPEDKEMIEAHFSTCEARLNSKLEPGKKPKWGEITMAFPKFYTKPQEFQPVPRDRDSLRNALPNLLKTPLDMNQLEYVKEDGQFVPKYSQWREAMITMMRGYMVTNPLPNRQDGKKSRSTSLTQSFSN